MFEEIIEAKSLDDGLQQLASRDFDALFLGPSIQIERTDAFFEQATEVSRAKDCAFICIFRDFLSGSEIIKASKAHVTVSDTCTKRAFTEAIVRAVLMACDSSPWPGVKLDSEGSILVSENGVWRKFDAENEGGGESDGTQGVSSLLGSGVLKILADCCAEEVKEETHDEFSRLIAIIIASDSDEVSSPAPEDTRAQTRQAVQEWVLDKDYMGPKEASRVLKKKLLAINSSEEE